MPQTVVKPASPFFLPPQSKGLGVAVIMVVYKTGRVLFDTLKAILANPAMDELILVDNGSKPEVEAYLKHLKDIDSRVTLLVGHGNIGFGRAVNLGAGTTRQPYLLVLNPDAFLREDCIEKLIETRIQQTKPCIVGARLLNEDMSEQRGSRRGEVTPVTALVSLLRLERFVRGLKGFELHLHDQPLPKIPVPMPTISGACFLMAREDFQALGGFDPNFFLHVEDIDLCWRMRRSGGEVIFHPHAEVIHIGQTSRATPIFVERHKAAGLAYFFKKRAKGPWRHLYIWMLTPAIYAIQHFRAALRRTGPDEE